MFGDAQSDCDIGDNPQIFYDRKNIFVCVKMTLKCQDVSFANPCTMILCQSLDQISIGTKLDLNRTEFYQSNQYKSNK